MPTLAPTSRFGHTHPTQRRSRATVHAFTLIELLVVITVIAILAGMLLGAINMAMKAARKNATKQLLTQLEMAITQYADAYGEPPPERLGTSPDYVSSECLAIFLARRKVTATDTRFPAAAKADFVPMKKAQFFDTNKNNCPEIIDAWALPIVYNRTAYANDGSNNFSDTDPPRHRPNSFDLFSCGPYASRITQLGGQLPNLKNYEKNALQENSNPESSNYRYLYKYEYKKVDGNFNEFIGNWQ